MWPSSQNPFGGTLDFLWSNFHSIIYKIITKNLIVLKCLWHCINENKICLQLSTLHGIRSPCCLNTCFGSNFLRHSPIAHLQVAMSTNVTLPPDSKLVYKGKNRKYIWSSYGLVSVGLLAASVEATYLFSSKLPYIINHWHQFESLLDIDNLVLLSVLQLSLLPPMFVATLLLTLRTLNKIHFSDKEQMFYGEKFTWYLKKTYVSFAPGEVQERSLSSYSPSFLQGNYLIRNKQYIIYAQNFISPMHYNLMLGN